MFGSRKRSAKSFDRSYYRTNNVKTSADDDATEIFSVIPFINKEKSKIALGNNSTPAKQQIQSDNLQNSGSLTSNNYEELEENELINDSISTFDNENAESQGTQQIQYQITPLDQSFVEDDSTKTIDNVNAEPQGTQQTYNPFDTDQVSLIENDSTSTIENWNAVSQGTQKIQQYIENENDEPQGPYRAPKTPAEAGRSRSSRVDAPSILPEVLKSTTTPGGFNVNVNFGRDRKKRKEVDQEYYDVGSFKFQLSTNEENSRDIYFIRMVAGGLNKKFLELVEVIDESVEPAEYRKNNKVMILSIYKYSDVLLKAWSGAMEMVKKMINGGDSKNTSELYQRLIENDTFLDALADYVVYKIANRNRGAIVTGKTKYNYAHDEHNEDYYLEQIMRPLHYTFGILKADLVEDYFT